MPKIYSEEEKKQIIQRLKEEANILIMEVSDTHGKATARQRANGESRCRQH